MKPKLFLSTRARFTLVCIFLVVAALGVVTTFFLKLYRNDKLASLFEQELSETNQLASYIQNQASLLKNESASSLALRIQNSREFLFTIESICSPQSGVTISRFHEKQLNDIKLGPLQWKSIPKVRALCDSNSAASLTFLSPGNDGPKAHVPSVFVFQVSTDSAQSRGGLLSLDGFIDEDDSHARVILADSGDQQWSDLTLPLLAQLFKNTALSVSELTKITARAKDSGVSSIIKATDNGIVSYARVSDDHTLLSLESEDSILGYLRYIQNQSLLLVMGFLFLSIWLGRLLASRITAPLEELKLASDAVGSGDSSRRLSVNETDEISLIKRSFNLMTERIRKLIEDTKIKAHLESEIQVAQQVQNLLLPKREIHVGEASAYSFVKMADKCGGDWWGIMPIEIPASRPLTLLMIGDVTGHGIPSALMTASAQGAFSTLGTVVDSTLKLSSDVSAQVVQDPTWVLKIFNRAVLDTTGGNLQMTFFAALLDPESNQIHCVNAGHNRPYLVKSDGTVKPLGGASMTLGREHNATFSDVESHPWGKDDQIFLYTDGLTDCIVKKGEEEVSLFERKHLIRSLKKHSKLKGKTLLDRILEERAKLIGALPAVDDVTAVVVCRKGGSR